MRFLGALLLAAGAAHGQEALELEEFEPAANLSAAKLVESDGATARALGRIDAQAGVDSRFDSPRGAPWAENVVDLRLRGQLGIDARLSSSVRVLVEGRGRWRAVSQRQLDRAKSDFEGSLGEAFLDWYTPWVDFRIGNQLLPWGANPLFAPADALNPRDLRESLLLGLPEYARLPTFAVRALGSAGPVTWTAAYLPFFQSHRYTVFGQDEALIQPTAGLVFPWAVDPSVEDSLQPHLLESERPLLGDVAVRATSRVGEFTVGGSWVWMNEKLPRVQLAPELGTLLASGDPSFAESFQKKLASLEAPFRGSYARQHLLSLEASRLVASAQVDVDVSWTPQQTFYDGRFNPVGKAVVAWAVGVSQAAQSPWVYAVSYLGMSVPDLNPQELLWLVEPSAAHNVPRAAWFHLVAGTVGYTFWNDQWEVSLRAAVEPMQGSFALGPRLNWKGLARTQLWLAAEFYEGPALSPLGYFNRNDQVVVGAQLDLF